MPKTIASKLKEMRSPNYRKGPEYGKETFDEFRERFRHTSDGDDESGKSVEVVIKLSSMEERSQKKLLILMQDILDIGRAASKIQSKGESSEFKAYFCPVSNPTNLIQTLSSFQFVQYSSDETPVRESLFWPGGGTMLFEALSMPAGTTIYGSHHDMETVDEAWHELSKLIRISLSTWSGESVNVEQVSASTSSSYSRWQTAYRKEMHDFISKIEHVRSAMPQISEKMNAWAEEWRELFIDQQDYRENMY